MKNPIEQYIQVQSFDNGKWHTTSQRFFAGRDSAGVCRVGQVARQIPRYKVQAGEYRSDVVE